MKLITKFNIQKITYIVQRHLLNKTKPKSEEPYPWNAKEVFSAASSLQHVCIINHHFAIHFAAIGPQTEQCTP